MKEAHPGSHKYVIHNTLSNMQKAKRLLEKVQASKAISDISTATCGGLGETKMPPTTPQTTQGFFYQHMLCHIFRKLKTTSALYQFSDGALTITPRPIGIFLKHSIPIPYKIVFAQVC